MEERIINMFNTITASDYYISNPYSSSCNKAFKRIFKSSDFLKFFYLLSNKTYERLATIASVSEDSTKNTIFVTGFRGCGKTCFMNLLNSMINSEYNLPEFKECKKNERELLAQTDNDREDIEKLEKRYRKSSQKICNTLRTQMHINKMEVKNENFATYLNNTLKGKSVFLNFEKGQASNDNLPFDKKFVLKIEDAVNLSYERGNTFMFGVTLRTNFNDLRPSYNDNARPQYQPQPQDAILQHSVVANQLTLLKYNAGLADPQIQAKGDTLYVTGEQVKYRDSREGIIRANRIVMNDLPDGIKTIRITENRLNMPQATTETDVASLKNHLAGEPLGHETTLAQKRVEPVVPQSTEQGWYIDKSRFDFHIDPVLNQSVGGPENFYMYQLGVMGTADLWLTDHLLTTGSLFANLANNYDKFNYTNPPQDSHLPRVRTHVREYVQNDVYVNNLQANYFQHLGNGFYGQVYGGYLETMFGGAGAEVLYRPLDSNWAFGVDANYVKQRDWRSAKDMMKFTDYSVKTGHLTAYWTPSFAQDVLVKASVGQYLAGDKGGTLEIAKRFDSGVVVGGYATITNVSKEEYGEGDFTKGVYVSVPLDLFSSGPTRSRAAIGWTPLTRDGGQQLGRKFQLYDMTSDRSVNFR